MRYLLTTLTASLAFAAGASAATLAVTPDATTYQVGDTITLNVFGDPEGETAVRLRGRLLFDEDLASHVSSSQTAVPTEFGRGFDTFPLATGPGFAEAFWQSSPDGSGSPGLGPLVATVLLEAVSVGSLSISWLTDSSNNDFNLRFFSVEDAPGTSVHIVPEPSTATLVSLGLLLVSASACRSPARQRRR